MNRKQRERVNKFWNIWVEYSARPDEHRDDPRGNFPEVVLEALEDYEEEVVQDCIEYAVYARPMANDRHDVKRVLSVIRNDGPYEACVKRAEADKEPYAYEPKPPKQLGSLDTVAEILKLPQDQWERDEEEDAFALTVTFDDRELRDLKEAAALEGKMERNMSPISFRRLASRNSARWLGREEKKKKSSEMPTPEEVLGDVEVSEERVSLSASYAGAKPLQKIVGSYEATQLRDVRLSLDVKANEMFKAGFSTEVIRAFHHDVPDGYWDAVEEQCEKNPEMLPEETYDLLLSRFDWDPEERQL